MKSPFIEKVKTIHLTEANMIIVNVYRPFGNIDTFFENLIQHIINLTKEEPLADILLMGDFNIDLMRTTKSSERLPGAYSVSLPPKVIILKLQIT